MKRDMELVVKILELIEGLETHQIDRKLIKIEGYSDDLIQGHVSLMLERGYLFRSGKFDPFSGDLHVSISWEGYNFLVPYRKVG